MQKNDLQKLGLFVAWLAALFYVGREIYELQRPTERTGMAIASAKHLAGRVQYKTANRIAWFDVGHKHPFYSGDVLATPSDGEAIIEFTGGGEIKVGPNSQIRLSAIKSATNLGLYIDLLQGDLDANAAKAGSANFLIKAGNEEIVLDKKGQSVSIAKVQGRAAVVQKREASPVKLTLAAKTAPQIPSDSLILKALPPAPIAIPVVETPPVAAAEPEKETAAEASKDKAAELAALGKNLEGIVGEKDEKKTAEPKKRPDKFRATFVDSSLEFWMAQHPQQAGTLMIPIEVRFESKQSLQAKQLYLGFFEPEASKKSEPKFTLSAVKVENNTALFQVPVSELTKNFRLGSTGWFTSIRASLAPGFSDSGRLETVSFLSQRNALELKNLISSSQRPVLVQADAFGLAAAGPSGIMHDSKENLPYRFQFEHASDLAKLKTVLASAQKINVRDGSHLGSQTVNFVKDGRVQLSSAKLSIEQIKEIYSSLACDMVFLGSKEALLDLRNVGNGNLSGYLRDQVDVQKQVYIARGSKVVPINVDFLLKSPEARSYINNQANAFFKSEVKVLVAR